jgi:hypothetical protein
MHFEAHLLNIISQTMTKWLGIFEAQIMFLNFDKIFFNLHQRNLIRSSL